MRNFLSRLRGRSARDVAGQPLAPGGDPAGGPAGGPGAPASGASDFDLDQALADMAWMIPPQTVHDPLAWDEHWHQQLTHRFTLGFIDMWCRDEELVRALQHMGAEQLLCVGSGLSCEPHALAAAGFHVTALDLSPLAMRVAATAQLNAEQLAHYFPAELARPGGTVDFVAGDLIDPTVCPGPYDVILERLSVQLFPDDERAGALDALVGRLSSDGVLFSHCHCGSGGPNTRPHALEALLTSRGWPFWYGRGQPKPAGQVAWLFSTTG